MIKVLFLCHGNICRSPMAEYVMKDMIKKANLSDQFYIASAATSTEAVSYTHLALPYVPAYQGNWFIPKRC